MYQAHRRAPRVSSAAQMPTRDPATDSLRLNHNLLRCLRLMAANDEKLNRGLPGVRVGEADRGAPGLIRFGTPGREALQREGGAPLGRRESRAIDD